MIEALISSPHPKKKKKLFLTENCGLFYCPSLLTVKEQYPFSYWHLWKWQVCIIASFSIFSHVHVHVIVDIGLTVNNTSCRIEFVSHLSNVLELAEQVSNPFIVIYNIICIVYLIMKPVNFRMDQIHYDCTRIVLSIDSNPSSQFPVPY